MFVRFSSHSSVFLSSLLFFFLTDLLDVWFVTPVVSFLVMTFQIVVFSMLSAFKTALMDFTLFHSFKMEWWSPIDSSLVFILVYPFEGQMQPSQVKLGAQNKSKHSRHTSATGNTFTRMLQYFHKHNHHHHHHHPHPHPIVLEVNVCLKSIMSRQFSVLMCSHAGVQVG